MKIDNFLSEDNSSLDTLSNILLGLPFVMFLFQPKFGVYLAAIVFFLNVIGVIVGKFLGEKLFRIALWGLILYGFIFIVIVGGWMLLMKP